MKAVIMAGGEGTRLRPITLTRPKPLVPVAGRACIDYVIDRLLMAGVTDIIITTGYRAAQILSYIGGGSRYGEINVVYSIEDIPMGTAGGVKKIEAFLDDTFIVASGDVLSDVDFSSLLDFHRKRKAEATMALTTVKDPTQFGIVGIASDGRIERFREKPPREEVFSNLINAGIYILEPEVLRIVPEKKMFDFSKQLFPIMLETGRRLFATPLKGLWKDIGNPEELIDANLRMVKRKGYYLSSIPKEQWNEVDIREPFMAEEGVKLGVGTHLAGAVLYSGCSVGENSMLEETVVLEEAKIGKGCVLRRTFVGRNAVIEEGAVLENCVIGDGEGVVAGAHLKSVRIPSS
ncbi:MAG TPA: NDP-sugar synthase [Anaerolineales bacterium]|nr:NDP-sugar synthase [Anaerolineales bacterium]